MSKYLEKSLLFKDKNTIKSCNIVSFFNRIFTISSSIYPIYRLNTQKEKLSNREHFILWITNGLKPKSLNSQNYDRLLELDIKIDNSFNILFFSKSYNL